MSTIRMDIASLFSTLTSLGLWGLYCGLVLATFCIMRQKGPIKWTSPVNAAIVAMYVLNLGTTVTVTMRAYDAFIGWPSGPLAFYETYSGAVYTIPDDTIFILVSVIGDCVLCWRVYMIWFRDIRVIILPAIGIFACFVEGFTVIVYDILGLIRGPNADVLASPENYWGVALYATMLASNWLMTGLILGRLWWASHQLKDRAVSNPIASQQYSRIIVALVESGACYSAAIGAITIACSAGNDTSVLLLYQSLPRIMGIALTMTVLQQSLGYRQPADPSSMNFASTGIQFAGNRAARTGYTTTQHPTTWADYEQDSKALKSCGSQLESQSTSTPACEKHERPGEGMP